MCDHPLPIRREWIDFKNDTKSLAWIDLCSMSMCSICQQEKNSPIDKGEVEVNYVDLGKRWKKEPSTVARWIQEWVDLKRLFVIAEPKSHGATGIYQVLEYADLNQPNILIQLDHAQRKTL